MEHCLFSFEHDVAIVVDDVAIVASSICSVGTVVTLPVLDVTVVNISSRNCDST